MDKKVVFSKSDVELKIPRLFGDATVETITSPDIQEFAKHYIENFTEYFLKGKAPLLLGASGVGKTFVAAAIAKALAPGGESGYNTPILWVDTVDAFNRLLDYRDLRQASAYFTNKRQIKSTPLIVLDDILQLREFDRIRELLFEIINSRYSERLPTIITANVSNAHNPIQDVANELGAPLGRRIREMSENLVLHIA